MPSVTEEQLVDIMSTFSNKMTAGDDQTPSFLIRDAKYILAKPLSILIYLAIRSSTCPDRWKRARITPVFKKGDSTNLKNYRPIAVLSNFAKLPEIVLYKNIFVDVQSHVSVFQHGIWPGRSTVTNLCTLTQFSSEKLDNNGQVHVISTYFSNAFDSINHNILLHKLSSFGFARSFLKLLESYLTT